MNFHRELLQLAIAYTFTGVVVFTAIATCLSLIGWVEFKNPAQQNRLFIVLVVEIVIVAVGFFGGFLKFDPISVERKIQSVERYQAIAVGLDKFIFSTEIIQEYLQNNWTTKTSLEMVIEEYNSAISFLRENETTNVQLIQVHLDETKARQFAEIMQKAKEIDNVVHTLNEELERVAILETQEKIRNDVSSEVAVELKVLLDGLKLEKTSFVSDLK